MSIADGYLKAIRVRMIADGCNVAEEKFDSRPVIVGYKAQMKALSRMHIFTAAVEIDRADEAAVRRFVEAVVNFALARKGQWRGMQSGVIAIPVLVANTADAEVAVLMRRAFRLNLGGFAVLVQPAVVDLSARQVLTFKGTRFWGYAHNSLIKQKCAAYLPDPASIEM